MRRRRGEEAAAAIEERSWEDVLRRLSHGNLIVRQHRKRGRTRTGLGVVSARGVGGSGGGES